MSVGIPAQTAFAVDFADGVAIVVGAAEGGFAALLPFLQLVLAFLVGIVVGVLEILLVRVGMQLVQVAGVVIVATGEGVGVAGALSQRSGVPLEVAVIDIVRNAGGEAEEKEQGQEREGAVHGVGVVDIDRHGLPIVSGRPWICQRGRGVKPSGGGPFTVREMRFSSVFRPGRLTDVMIRILCLVPCFVFAFGHQGAGATDRPNILLILADDLGYGDVASYNPESKVATPHLDRLAAEGMRFTDAHSPSTVCTPTRYSILTGRMAFRTGMRGVFDGAGGPCLIEEGRLTLGGLLQTRGYHSALVGKWHIGLTFLDRQGQPICENGLPAVRRIDFSRAIPDAPIHRGFDEFFGTACCPTTDWLYAFIEGDRIPVPPTGILDKTGLPQHDYSRDNRPGMHAPGFDLEEIDQVFLRRSLHFLEEHVGERAGQPFFLFHSMQAVHLPSFPSREFQGRSGAGPHGDFILEMDHVVGRLMEALRAHGLEENTLVIFTSDNGPEVPTVLAMRRDHDHDGARPWRGVKRDNWEGGHRVPFLIRWPNRVPAGTVSDQTLCLTDLMATIAALTGAALPEDAGEDSVNLLPVFLGEDEGEPVREYTLHQTISLALGIRWGRWKYLDHRGSGGNDYGRDGRWGMKAYALPETAPDAPGQLFDLEADPGETTNLYFEHPEVVERLRAKLYEFRESGRSVER